MTRFYWIVIIIFLAACSTTSPTNVPEEPTYTPSGSVLRPTPTEEFVPVVVSGPVPSPTPPCAAAPATRMIVGDRGYVLNEDSRPLNVRSQPGTDKRILGRLEVLDTFLVLDGPVCAEEYVWYFIDSELYNGWIAEGDFASYYIAPYLPG